MTDWIGSAIQQLIQNVMSGGERALKARALGVAVRGIRGIRGLLLLNTIWAFLCFLSAMSTFATLGILAWRFEQELALWSPVTVSTGAISIVSTLLLCFLFREQAWVKAFRLEELVDQAVQLSQPPESQRTSTDETQAPGIDYDLLERMIERSVARALETQSSPSESHSPVQPIRPRSE